MALVGCTVCGNAFESSKAKQETIQLPARDKDADKKIPARVAGRQVSSICPACGSTGADRVFEPKDENFEGGYGDQVEIGADYKDITA